MKETDHFKQTIKDYLISRAKEDSLFHEKLKNPKKKLADCIQYIYNTVQKSKRQGFNDDEIYNMAVHYYDEEKIDVGKEIKGSVVVNHQIQLTEEEITKAKKNAKDKVMSDEIARLTKKPIAKKSTAIQPADKDKQSEPTTLF